jgi:DNA-binding beta-propeller fold protein YncE
MSRSLFFYSIGLIATLILLGCSETQAPLENQIQSNESQTEQFFFNAVDDESPGQIVVANRASGSISVIDVEADTISGTYDLPMGNSAPEPMYVVYSNQTRRVFVGDRANNRVVAFDSRSFDVVGTIDAGAGVFHMWSDQRSKQLWVNNDIDNNTTVINPRTLEVVATVPTPADLVALGGKPHDVILDHVGKYAYISILGVSGSNDYVVQFSTSTFQETGRSAVGKDPHLSLTRRNKYLYVPCQNSDAVYILDQKSLAQIKIVSATGAHGAGMPQHGKTFYTTNLPGGGTDGLIAINTKSNSLVGTSNTPYAIPHNIAITQNSHKLYVTHSGGSSDKVTVYTISPENPVPVYLTEIIVGLNPFGLAFSK